MPLFILQSPLYGAMISILNPLCPHVVVKKKSRSDSNAERQTGKEKKTKDGA